MNVREMRGSLEHARYELRIADEASSDLASMLVGRCRAVTKNDAWADHDILVALKKELSQYNAKKREWKS